MVAVQMPAVCRRCQRPFPSMFVADNVQRMTVAGNTSGPCPYCGARVGDIPDGVYDVMDSTIVLLERLPTSRDELLAAAGILQRHLANGDADVDAIEREILEAASGASALVQLLRDPATASVLAAIALIVSIILGILSLHDQSRVMVQIDQEQLRQIPDADDARPPDSPPAAP